MIPSLKSEFRKLLSVRSTYYLLGFALLVIGVFTFYFEGYRGNIPDSAASTLGPTALQEIIKGYASIAAGMSAVIAILFMAHEYRYSTIMYTLTAQSHRTKVLLAKTLTMIVFGLVVGLVAAGFAIASYLLGVSLRGDSLAPQNFDVWSQIGRLLAYTVGYTLMGLILAALVRNLVAAVAVFLIYPATIEPLLSLLIKDNAVYLPFASLDTIVGSTFIVGSLTPIGAVGVAYAYLVAGWVAAWLLFLKRDAN